MRILAEDSSGSSWVGKQPWGSSSCGIIAVAPQLGGSRSVSSLGWSGSSSGGSSTGGLELDQLGRLLQLCCDLNTSYDLGWARAMNLQCRLMLARMGAPGSSSGSSSRAHVGAPGSSGGSRNWACVEALGSSGGSSSWAEWAWEGEAEERVGEEVLRGTDGGREEGPRGCGCSGGPNTGSSGGSGGGSSIGSNTGGSSGGSRGGSSGKVLQLLRGMTRLGLFADLEFELEVAAWLGVRGGLHSVPAHQLPPLLQLLHDLGLVLELGLLRRLLVRLAAASVSEAISVSDVARGLGMLGGLGLPLDCVEVVRMLRPAVRAALRRGDEAALVAAAAALGEVQVVQGQREGECGARLWELRAKLGAGVAVVAVARRLWLPDVEGWGTGGEGGGRHLEQQGGESVGPALAAVAGHPERQGKGKGPAGPAVAGHPERQGGGPVVPEESSRWRSMLGALSRLEEAGLKAGHEAGEQGQEQQGVGVGGVGMGVGLGEVTGQEQGGGVGGSLGVSRRSAVDQFIVAKLQQLKLERRGAGADEGRQEDAGRGAGAEEGRGADAEVGWRDAAAAADEVLCSPPPVGGVKRPAL